MRFFGLAVLFVKFDIVAIFGFQEGGKILAVFDGAAVDPGFGLLDRDIAALGDLLEPGLEERIEEPVVHLVGLLGRGGAHEDLGGRLVVAAGEELGLDAEHVEQAAEVGLLAVETADPEERGRGGGDARGACEENIIAHCEGIGMDEDVLVGGAERGEGLAKFFDLRGTELGVFGEEDDGFDGGILRGLGHARGEVAQ